MITTFNKTFMPKMKKAIDNNWHLLQINSSIAEKFPQKPRQAYRRNKNLRDIIGSNTIENNKVKRKSPKTSKNIGRCRPCQSKKGGAKCCQQVLDTTTFKSIQTQKTYTMRHNLDCRSTFVIYLLECMKCHIQYVGKSEKQFKMRLSHHRYEVTRPNGIPAPKHFNDVHHEHTRCKIYFDRTT